jgi:hypothetical protein
VSSAELVNGSPLILPGKLLYVPDPPHVDMPPPPTLAASCAAVANTPPAHLAQASWRPAKASSGLICQPLPGGLQRGQDVHNPGGPKAGDRLREPPEGPCTPALAQYLLQRPPLAADLPRRSLPLPQSSLRILKLQAEGAHVEDRVIVFKYIFFIRVSLIMVSVRQ